MTKLNGLVAMGALAMMFTGCKETPDTHDADVKAIQDTEAQWVKDFAAKDADKIVSHYADDATLMAPGEPATSGIDPIRAMVKGMTADPALSLQFQASKVIVAKSGDIGFTQGSYTMTMTDPQTKKVVNDHGSYVTTYRKQPDGTWKAEVDIVTSDVPPPAPPPAPVEGKKKRK